MGWNRRDHEHVWIVKEDVRMQVQGEWFTAHICACGRYKWKAI